MTEFMQQAMDRHPRRAPSWLAPWHDQGQASWQSARWPTRKTEAWKYTDLRPLEQGGYLNEPEPVSAEAETALRESFEVSGLDACTLVFVNGVYSAALSSQDVPEGVELVRFSEASDDQVQRITQHLSSVVKREQHLFAALNEVWLNDGVFLRVARNTQVKQPLQLVWLTTPQANAFSVSQRLLVLVESGAQATVMEHFASDAPAQNSFTNGVTELLLQDNAQLHHYRLHLEEEHALHIGGVHAAVERDAKLDSFHMALGGALKRVDLVVNYRGQGASCNLNGVYLPRHEQQVDYHTCVEHAVPHCKTSEVFRGIVADRARAVFNGRIHIHPDAQKTLAQLSNKNLLTSDKAEVDTKPELEIYADDVQCAHGATVAQLDDTAVHYLQTRGISRQEAEVMLSFGFINELVDKLPHQAISDYLRPVLARLFARSPELARHIA